MGVPRTALFFCLARRQSPLQTNCYWRSLGDIATVLHHARFQLIFWQTSQAPDEWPALSYFLLLCAFALELLCYSLTERDEYRGRSAAVDHQDLFSPSRATDIGCPLCPG